MRRLNRYSQTITQPKKQGASQAMLYATGMGEADMDKAQVGIASVWYEGNPCNMHLLDLANTVKASVKQADLVGMRFNTIGVSDGISMGTAGMRYSLPSREVIADSIETIMSAQWYDGCIALPGCDKNMPGCLMALARLNRPSFIIYGGTIKAGCHKKKAIEVMANLSAVKLTKLNAKPLSKTPAPVPVPVAACTPPTPWLLPLKRWA